MPALSVTRATREAAESAGVVVSATESATLAALGGDALDAPACFGKRATMPAELCAGCTWAPTCPAPAALPPPPASFP
jgi:hypothetical protein